MIKRVVLQILTLNIILIIGCVSPMNQGPTPSGNNQEKKEVIELPERILLNRNDLPAEVELVMAATINMIRGGKEKIPNVDFDREGKHQFLEESFSYKGFDVEYVDIIYYKTGKIADNIRHALLEYGLYFSDAIGRSAYVRIRNGYALMKKDIIITNTEYEILPNPYPKILAFILPEDAVESAPPEVKNNFVKLFLLAQQKAVNMEANQKERIKYEKYQKLSSSERLIYKSDSLPRSYYVMVFCMERLRQESRFIMTVSNEDKASANNLANPYYLKDSGWIIGIAKGKFAIDAFDKEIFFHAQFNPGIDPKNNYLKHISSFSSIKNYDSNQNEKSLNPYLDAWKKQNVTTNQATSATEGSISSGKVFLNPIKVEDAKSIQKKLADSGFYSMKIDGVFGKNSKQALENFKKANGLENNSVWDLKTQKTLFKGSGL